MARKIVAQEDCIFCEPDPCSCGPKSNSKPDRPANSRAKNEVSKPSPEVISFVTGTNTDKSDTKETEVASELASVPQVRESPFAARVTTSRQIRSDADDALKLVLTHFPGAREVPGW